MDIRGRFEEIDYADQRQLRFFNLVNYKQSVHRRDLLSELYSSLVRGASNEEGKILSILSYVQKVFIQPKFVPIDENGTAVYEPLILLDIRWPSCGQTNRVLVDLLQAGGRTAEMLQLNGHVAATVQINGDWKFLDGDALTNGLSTEKWRRRDRYD